MIRKIATPASRAMTVTAAITAALEKIRSPRLRRPPEAPARIWPAWVVVSVWASMLEIGRGPAPSRGAPDRQLMRSLSESRSTFGSAGDRVDSRLDVVADARRQRRRARILGRDLLAVGAGDVLEV